MCRVNCKYCIRLSQEEIESGTVVVGSLVVDGGLHERDRYRDRGDRDRKLLSGIKTEEQRSVTLPAFG